MRRIVVLAVGLVVLGALPASAAAPDVVRRRACGDGARARLELTYIQGEIKVRFEVYQSPPGHEWYVELRRFPSLFGPAHIFRGIKVASDSGDFWVARRRSWGGVERFVGRARDTQTGEVCRVLVPIG